MCNFLLFHSVALILDLHWKKVIMFCANLGSVRNYRHCYQFLRCKDWLLMIVQTGEMSITGFGRLGWQMWMLTSLHCGDWWDIDDSDTSKCHWRSSVKSQFVVDTELIFFSVFVCLPWEKNVLYIWSINKFGKLNPNHQNVRSVYLQLIRMLCKFDQVHFNTWTGLNTL